MKMMSNLQPLGFRVLIKPRDIEEKTEGGIILVDETKDAERRTTQVGHIVAIGPTAWSAFDDGQKWAEVGDKVVYVKYGGKLIKDPDSGVEYVLLNDEDVLLKITGDSDE